LSRDEWCVRDGWHIGEVDRIGARNQVDSIGCFEEGFVPRRKGSVLEGIRLGMKAEE
jgi:hypothetical protein